MSGRIRFVGVSNKTGIGTHVRNVLAQLGKYPDLAHRLELVSREHPNEVEASILRSQEEDINIFFLDEGAISSRYKGLKIIWHVFDLTAIPADEISSLLRNYHEIWVPSDWARQILLLHAIPFSRIRVMPEGVDPEIYFPSSHELSTKNERFRIIQVGKYETRKGYLDSVSAINQAFGGRSDTEYLVKCDWINGSNESKTHPKALALMQTSQVPVVTAFGAVDDPEMARLYRSADVFLFPSRGEGWGLPLIEALACGVPCITTCHSGQSEFLKAIEGLYLPVDFTLRPMDCPETKARLPRSDGNWGLWACPDINDFAKKLQSCRTQHTLWRTQALEASAIIRKNYSWERCAKRVFEALQSITSYMSTYAKG